MKNQVLFLAIIFFSTQAISQEINSLYDPHGLTNRDNKKQGNTSGTNNLLKNGNEWTSIGPFGGDVLDIAIDPTNTEQTFAAAGFPYTRNGMSDNWHLMEQLFSISQGGIHCFEANENGVLFAAGNFSYGKIYISTDGGDTWQQKNLPAQAGVYDITIDPSDPDKIYVAMSSNISGSQNKVIVKSEDGGDTWTAIDMTTWLPIGWACVSVAVDPNDSLTIFAIGNESFSNAKVLYTADGGSSWQDVSAGLPTGKPYNTVTINDGIVYVTGGQLFGGQVMGVYKSENYGSSWQNMSVNFPNKVANDIIINPNDANKMYVATEGDGIYYTLDGGTTWNYNTSGAGDNGSARSLLFHPDDPDIIYAGFLSLGVCVSENAGVSWESSTIGIASLILNDIEIDPSNPDIILAGFEAENSGGCYIRSEGEWNLVSGLPGTRFSQVSIGIDGAMYAWSNGPTTVASEGLYKSTDGGEVWTNLGPDIGSVFETQIFGLTLSYLNPDLIFIAGNNFGANGWESMIYRSTDGGENWDNVFMGPENDGFKYIHIDPNSNDQIIYAAYKSETGNAGFLKSIDNGTNWLPINDGLPADAKWSGAIISDPTNSDILYGGLGGYGGVSGTLYKSENSGSSWTQANISLSNYCKITDFLISPMDSNIVYASTSYDGVFITEDAENWQAANEGLPAGNVTGFSNAFQDENDKWLFLASTFTNSAFSTQVWDPGTTGLPTRIDAGLSIHIYPNPAITGIYIEIPEGINKNTLLQIIQADGRIVYEKQNIQPVEGFYLSTEKLEPGVYWVRISSKTVYNSGKFIKAY
ncbi:MAG: T9SS type A sorting domain-containing protein [Bacteroidales bacterium]|nr:T9SS type A sorting domain-containing protein [Bacteroidales bacterium]